MKRHKTTRTQHSLTRVHYLTTFGQFIGIVRILLGPILNHSLAMCQGLLDGFEANGIRYYNKYATLKEWPGQVGVSRVLSRMSRD